MKGIPQGRYTKEFREEAVKLVLVSTIDIRPHFLGGGKIAFLYTVKCDD